MIGDQAHVRERAAVGEGSVVGRGSAVDNDVTIGARVRIQTGCYITAYSTIEDDVFVAPGVTLTNDDTMGRHGPRLRDVVHSWLVAAREWRGCPSGRRGRWARGGLRAAGAVVIPDVPPRAGHGRCRRGRCEVMANDE